MLAGGRRWYHWSASLKWVSDDCERYTVPNGRRFAGPEQVGVGSTPGMETECPEPTPVETPTPGECVALSHLKIVGFCAGCCPGCMENGGDWGNPPILKAQPPKNMYLSATYVDVNGREIHSYDRCYPGGVDGGWTERVMAGDHIDAGDPWSDGHNLTLYDLDFPTRNRYTACGHGVCGNTLVTVR